MLHWWNLNYEDERYFYVLLIPFCVFHKFLIHWGITTKKNRHGLMILCCVFKAALCNFYSPRGTKWNCKNNDHFQTGFSFSSIVAPPPNSRHWLSQKLTFRTAQTNSDVLKAPQSVFEMVYSHTANRSVYSEYCPQCFK